MVMGIGAVEDLGGRKVQPAPGEQRRSQHADRGERDQVETPVISESQSARRIRSPSAVDAGYQSCDVAGRRRSLAGSLRRPRKRSQKVSAEILSSCAEVGDGMSSLGAPRRQFSVAGVLLGALLLFISPGVAVADIDHKVEKDDSGIWARSNQNVLRYGALVVNVSMALYEGDGSRLGHTSWQSMDSVITSSVITEIGKRVFGRQRPADTNDPNEWFSGGKSFPSGEVAEISSIVTPYVLEYRHDQPMVYALELLPVYDAIARVKVQAHWQTDVIAGFAIGTGAGYWAHEQAIPFTVRVMPHGITVGLKTRF
jgi:hypothetical protein